MGLSNWFIRCILYNPAKQSPANTSSPKNLLQNVLQNVCQNHDRPAKYRMNLAGKPPENLQFVEYFKTGILRIIIFLGGHFEGAIS